MTPALDVIGDVHGQLAALRALGHRLGYGVDSGWEHPQHRVLVFVGDLVDRGPASLETAELVADLCARGRALCLMGNHEYNLVGHARGLVGRKPSNGPTIADVQARPARWAPLLAWMSRLPVAIELPDLRVIHAVWHLPSMAALLPVLGRADVRAAAAPTHGDAAALASAVVLGSPFDHATGLRPGLPQQPLPPGDDRPHEILIKGYEREAPAPFVDADGHTRTLERACWWRDADSPVPRDRRTIFGHYWSLPPRAVAALFAPPHPPGHPDNATWIRRHASELPPEGTYPVPSDERFICVDYNGLLHHHPTGCIGAYRHPEAQVAWASAAE